MTAALAHEFAGATHAAQTQKPHALAPILAESHQASDTQFRRASATPPATVSVVPCTHPTGAVAPISAESHTLSDPQNGSASAPNFSSSQNTTDAQKDCAAAEPSSAESQGDSETQTVAAPGGFLRNPVLSVLADVVDDLETVRIANANRVSQLTRTGTDKDGGERGFGLTLEHPEVAKLAETVKALESAEHDAILNLQRALRKHPLAPFQKRHKGIGEKQLARLLAAIGDPHWNDLHQRPRTVSELWAYCGLHVIRTSGSQAPGDTHKARAAGTPPHAGSQKPPEAHRSAAPGVAPKRQRGQRSNWSETARKRVWVIASAMPKFPGGIYEQVYRDGRTQYADAMHSVDCVRCGPAGKPALAGSPLSDGHKHARAVRLVAKAILRDLWIESRGLYEGER